MTKNNNDNDNNIGNDNDDDKLWEQVKQGVKPLKSENRNLVKPEVPTPASPPPKGNVGGIPKTVAVRPMPPKSQPFKPSPIDPKTYKSIATQKTKIDGRIDLHKRTQEEAKSDLKKFLSAAQATKKRIVLVITGKGTDNKGVLKQNVPKWLEVPPLNKYVNGFCAAHRNHGGEGALYVRIRKE